MHEWCQSASHIPSRALTLPIRSCSCAWSKFIEAPDFVSLAPHSTNICHAIVVLIDVHGQLKLLLLFEELPVPESGLSLSDLFIAVALSAHA